MNSYVLSYNPVETNISHVQLSTFVKENRKITQWFQPFIGTYILKSQELPVSLTESFRGLFDGAPFIISLINPYGVGGAQEQYVWDWFNTGIIPSLLPPPAPKKGLF